MRNLTRHSLDFIAKMFESSRFSPQTRVAVVIIIPVVPHYVTSPAPEVHRHGGWNKRMPPQSP